MTPIEIADLAERLQYARNNNLIIDPLSEPCAPESMEDAVKIALAAMPTRPVAWKLGGTNQATRGIFGVEVPYFGPLRDGVIYNSGEVISRSAFPAPLMAEPEIAVAFNQSFEPALERRDESKLAAALDWVAPAIEMPATCLKDVSAAGVNWLVADCCAAGALVVGQRLAPRALSMLEDASCYLEINHMRVSGTQHSLIGRVLGSVADALCQFGRYGLRVEQGAVLATGGLFSAISVQLAEDITGYFREERGDNVKVTATLA